MISLFFSLIVLLIIIITILYFKRKKTIEKFADDDNSGQPYGIWDQNQIDTTFNTLGSNLDDLTGKYSTNSQIWNSKIGNLERTTVGMENNVAQLSDNMARDFVILHGKDRQHDDKISAQNDRVSALDGNFSKMSSHVGDIDKKLLDIQSTNTSNYTLLNVQITSNSGVYKKFTDKVTSNLQGINDGVTNKLQNQAVITSNLSGSITQFNNLLNTTNANVNTQTNVINNLQNNITAFQTNIDFIKSNYAVSADLKNLQSSLSSLSESLPNTYAKSTDLGPLSGQITGITSSLNALQSNLSSLTGIVTQIQGTYVNQKSVTDLANTINLAQNSINDVKNLVNTINTNYATKNDIAGLQSSIISGESAISALTAGLGNDQAAINNLKSLSANLSSIPSQSNISLLQSSLSNLAATVQTNTSNINGMNSGIQNNASAINNINTNLSSLQTTINNINSTVTSFQTSANNSYASKSDLNAMNTTLQSQIALLQNASNSTSSTLSLLKTDKIQLGNKWQLSGVGDHDANDNWLRMMDSNGAYYGGIAMAQLWTRDNSWLNGNTNVTGPLAATGPTNQLRDSWLPYSDGNSYIRAGGDGKVINIGDYYNNDVNLGKPNTNVNLRGTVWTPSGINITNNDPGSLVEKNYGSKDDRYGIGQYPNGQTKVYTSSKFQPANVSLSFAKPDGTLADGLTVSQDGKLNATTTINGNLVQNGMTGMNDNKIRLRNINDGNHSLGYDGGVDGPALQGNMGGKLTTANGQTALQWDNGGNTYTNNTKMSANWSGYPDSKTNGSEIANDINGFKQLMIVGNRSGGGERRVGVWDTLNVNGTLNANGPINTPAGIHVNNGDPGPLIDKNYGTNDNRYGIGQFPNGQTRLYTGGAYQPANVNLSIAKADGTFVDALTVSKDGNLNPTTTISGTTNTGDLYANNTKMSANWSGYPDNKTNGSEIANDTNGFKQLMIVGNKSGGGERRVGVWDTLNVNGTLNANGPINTPAGIHVNNNDPGPLIDKNYGGNDNRYGIGQFANGQTRVYTAGAYPPGNVNLSIAKADGSFVDAVTVSKDGNLNPTTTINGPLNVNGRVWSSTNFQTSDEKLKENIQPLTQQDLDDLDKLSAKSYNLKSDKTQRQKFGFISQDVEKIYPNLVTGSGPNGQQGLDYTGLVAPIVANIQELKRKINNKEICLGDVCFDVNEFKKLKELLKNQA